jgi:hypothetical protein
VPSFWAILNVGHIRSPIHPRSQESAEEPHARPVPDTAWHMQLNQVLGPSRLDKNEYDIDAKAAGSVTRKQIARMLCIDISTEDIIGSFPEDRLSCRSSWGTAAQLRMVAVIPGFFQRQYSPRVSSRAGLSLGISSCSLWLGLKSSQASRECI